MNLQPSMCKIVALPLSYQFLLFTLGVEGFELSSIILKITILPLNYTPLIYLIKVLFYFVFFFIFVNFFLLLTI